MEPTKVQAVDQAVKEITETFNSAIKEARGATLGTFVVAYVTDGTPFRDTGDGKIAMYGPTIYSTDDERAAARVAQNINKQFATKRIKSRVQVEQSNVWRGRRISVLLGYIADIVTR